jgi:hypothetical protein
MGSSSAPPAMAALARKLIIGRNTEPSVSPGVADRYPGGIRARGKWLSCFEVLRSSREGRALVPAPPCSLPYDYVVDDVVDVVGSTGAVNSDWRRQWIFGGQWWPASVVPNMRVRR